MGYAPELASVRYNQSAEYIHRCDTIIMSPSFLLPLGDSIIHHRSYYDMRGCITNT
jgi:hypothetical protein